MKIALIGYGYWGKKIYQTLVNVIPKDNIFIIDPYFRGDRTSLQFISLNEALSRIEINKILIATPEETHFSIAKECLENNKDVFVEKPLCLKENEAKQLHKLAKKNNLQIYVYYIFLRDAYVKKIKEIIDSNKIGKLSHIESVRHSININKPNITVLDDLATHDIYLGKYFFKNDLNSFEIIKENINSNQINQASILFNFKNQTLAAHYSWIQPIAKRKMTFFGDKAALIWDKSNSDILLYKNQTLAEKISVSEVSSSLEISIKKFLYEKSNYDYTTDVLLLEQLDNS